MHPFCPRCGIELSEAYKFCPRCAYRLRPDLVEHRPLPERIQSRGARLVALGGYLAFTSLLLLVVLQGIWLFVEQTPTGGAPVQKTTRVVTIRDRDALPLDPDGFLTISGGETFWGLYRPDLYEQEALAAPGLVVEEILDALALASDEQPSAPLRAAIAHFRASTAPPLERVETLLVALIDATDPETDEGRESAAALQRALEQLRDRAPETGFRNEDLPRLIYVDDDTQLGLFEVTNDWYLEFLSALASRQGGSIPRGRSPVHWTRPTDVKRLGVPRVYERKTGNHPVVNVTLSDALEYAAWFWETALHADPDRIVDLPTADEFVRTARGGNLGDNFPWGFGFRGGVVNYDRRRPLPVNAPEVGIHRGLHALLGNAAEWVHGPNKRPHVAGGSFELPREILAQYEATRTEHLFDREPWPEATPFDRSGFDWRTMDGDVGFRLAIRHAPHLPEFAPVTAGTIRYGQPREPLLPPSEYPRGYFAVARLAVELPKETDRTSWEESHLYEESGVHLLRWSETAGGEEQLAEAFFYERPLSEPDRELRPDALPKLFERDDPWELEDKKILATRDTTVGGRTAHERTILGVHDGDPVVLKELYCRVGARAYRLWFERSAEEPDDGEVARDLEILERSVRFFAEDAERNFLFRIPSDPAWKIAKVAEPEDPGTLRIDMRRGATAQVRIYCQRLGPGERDRTLEELVDQRTAPPLADERPAATVDTLGATPALRVEEDSSGTERRRRWFCRRRSLVYVPADGGETTLEYREFLYQYVEEIRGLEDPALRRELDLMRANFRFIQKTVILPEGTAEVERPFEISRTAVTNRQYLAFLVGVAPDKTDEEIQALTPLRWGQRNAGARRTETSFKSPFGTIPWVFWAGEENRPVWVGREEDPGASLAQARAYAAWLTRRLGRNAKLCRLPTLAEYLRAGRGDRLDPYPWGDDPSTPLLVAEGDWYPTENARPVSLLGRLDAPPPIVGLVGNLMELVRLPDTGWLLAGGWYGLTPANCTLDSLLGADWGHPRANPQGFHVVLVEDGG